MSHFGVKHLFDVSGNNEKIDEDDEDAIFEALDRPRLLSFPAMCSTIALE